MTGHTEARVDFIIPVFVLVLIVIVTHMMMALLIPKYH